LGLPALAYDRLVEWLLILLLLLLLLQVCEPGFKDAQVIDSAVLRFPKAVTHFSPGSYASR
jgi:hypothetical protein